jgi:23S rRNA pseudouridine1911/1915/1917 synthase
MEKILNVEVTEGHRGERLDKFLAEHLREDYSRAFIQRLIQDGKVLVSGNAVKRHYNIVPGEFIEITVPEPTEYHVEAENIPIDVVYEDEHLLVVNKSQEMVVHPAPGNYSGTLVNALLWYCKTLSGVGGVQKPGIVHRIDKGTSGLLVVAKDDKTHRGLSIQFKNKTTRRVYYAIVKGVVELDNGIIELSLSRSHRDRKKMVVSFDEENSRVAVTQYKVLKRFKDMTLVELVLGTGRTHQIRVHMAYIGHPILGDEKYGSRSPLGRPALHAKTLGFVHPITGKYLEFTSELPKDMQEIIERESGIGSRKSGEKDGKKLNIRTGK